MRDAEGNNYYVKIATFCWSLKGSGIALVESCCWWAALKAQPEQRSKDVGYEDAKKYVVHNDPRTRCLYDKAALEKTYRRFDETDRDVEDNCGSRRKL